MTPEDVPEVAALAQRKREQYQEYQPQFWRVADDAVALHTSFIEHMAKDDGFVTLVAAEGDEIRGFVTGRLVPIPPVYDPGGKGARADSVRTYRRD